MTCFKIVRGSQDQQLPLAVGLKSNAFKLLDSRGKLWSIANFVICEDGTSSPARSREQLYDEYLECFRTRINAFNINTVADDQEVSWLHYLELIWMHGACQTVRRYRPELHIMFSSRENKDYPTFNPKADSVDATSMFRSSTLAWGEQAFLTATYPWTVLIATAEDLQNMDGFCPMPPFQDVPARPRESQGIPLHYNVNSNRGSSDLGAQQQVELNKTSSSYSVPGSPQSGNLNLVYPTPEGSQHIRNSSGTTDTGLQKLRRLSHEKTSKDVESAIKSIQDERNVTIPASPISQVPKDMNCAVQIKFNEKADNKEVFATIHTGAIYSFTRVPAENRMSMVELVFMTPAGAQKYIHATRSRKDILIRSQRVVAVWSPNRVGPCQQENVSRVLKFTNTAPGLGLSRFIKYCRACCWVDIINKQVQFVGSDREIIVEFGSYGGQAEVVYARLKGRIDSSAGAKSGARFAACRVVFMRDPCDVLEDEGK